MRLTDAKIPYRASRLVVNAKPCAFIIIPNETTDEPNRNAPDPACRIFRRILVDIWDSCASHTAAENRG